MASDACYFDAKNKACVTLTSNVTLLPCNTTGISRLGCNNYTSDTRVCSFEPGFCVILSIFLRCSEAVTYLECVTVLNSC